jgi:hypothetical protein
MMVASFLFAVAAFAQTEQDTRFQKELTGYTLVDQSNVELLRQHNWTGHFIAYLGGHKTCEGDIDLSYFHPKQPDSDLHPPGVPAIDIAYKHTPHFGECLHTKAFAPYLDHLDSVRTPCDPARQFRTATLGKDAAIYSPKCKNGFITWKKLPTKPSSWVSADGKTLKSLVEFTIPGPGPKLKVYYDLAPQHDDVNPDPPRATETNGPGDSAPAP